MVIVCVKLLNSCDAAFLLLIWSVVSSSAKLLIKVAIEVSQHETLFYEFQFLFVPYYHLPIPTFYKVMLFYCRRITAKLSL